ncbi:uncharacterized protein LOC135489874 [Lineus longissimus]|uniref:uncharacterized protein LOC135489874 n=1 Tax=Lineus longissimus TaxID=88925 RepID=UPI00315D9E70
MLVGTLFVCLFLLRSAKANLDTRLSIIRDKQGHKHARLAFSTANGHLRCAAWLGSAAHEESWSSWSNLNSPTPLVSNPATVHDEHNLTHVFAQGNDGQVYTLTQEPGKTGCVSFSKQLTHKIDGNKKLPFDAKAFKGIIGRDSITSIRTQRDNDIYVFSRSYNKPSGLFFTVFNGKVFTPWKSLGGDLISDVSVVDNVYTHYLEAYGIFADGKIHRIWQWKDKSWSSWRSMSYGQPALVTTTRPVAEAMSSNTFNGGIDVFALGKDGMIHHCYQTTCDMVNNFWGLCTWSWWYKLKEKTPRLLSEINGISVGRNIHGGNEIFMLGKDHRVWHMWQMERGASYEHWETIGQPVSNVASLPLVDEDLWWGVHFEDNQNNKIIAVKQSRSMVVYPPSVAFGGILVTSWDVPRDESVGKDWIGIFRAGAGNDEYLDYRYVNGALNPGGRPVPEGKAGLKLFLPKGKYEVRYLVGSHVSVLQRGIVSNSSAQSSRWTQVFQGFNRGLGQDSITGPDCVDDGEMMVAKFELAFTAFIKKDFHLGLHLLGKAIHEMYTALITCGEVKLAYKILAFAKDLVECTMDLCIALILNLTKDVFILYKARYEIYWDIRAAINAFEVGAYEQGAISIGHVIRDALGLPNTSIIKDEIINSLLVKSLEEIITT